MRLRSLCLCFGFLAEREICGKFTIITACTYNKIQGIYMHPESSHKYIDLVIFISATTISIIDCFMRKWGPRESHVFILLMF